jgi:hypothetical protein
MKDDECEEKTRPQIGSGEKRPEPRLVRKQEWGSIDTSNKHNVEVG